METVRYFVTTAIPYVNAEAHLGHALELVQADVLARHRRLRGQQVRFVTGTDDNALKNVTAARAAGVAVRDFVDANAERFRALRGPLDLSTDDFTRTSGDGHRAGVEQLWGRCAARGDYYRDRYQGLYCLGCEQFYTSADLVEGRCPEHASPLEEVDEENWFFRLSRYSDAVEEAIVSDRVRIDPPARRNEALGFVRGGLRDISVSRPAQRSDGWGIPVPGDAGQVIYVWWEALATYITAVGYGTGHTDHYRTWWREGDERVHVIGKGILRFHAVHWLAQLLAAGEPLPTRILVHDYLTVDGAKLSKSAGNAIGPLDLVGRFGVDAVRWWLLRDVARVGETDFAVSRLVQRADTELANGLGNLVNRVTTLVWKHRHGTVPTTTQPLEAAADLTTAIERLPTQVDDALEHFDFRTALTAIWGLVEGGNRLVEDTRPWDLAAAQTAGDTGAGPTLDAVLNVLVSACRAVTTELSPFIPSGAARLRLQLGTGGEVARPSPVFPRLHQQGKGSSERDGTC